MKIMDYESNIKYRNYQTTRPKNYDIQLKGVTFKYPSQEEGGEPVLRNLDLNVEKNKTVALVGHSGCGKSTII